MATPCPHPLADQRADARGGVFHGEREGTAARSGIQRLRQDGLEFRTADEAVSFVELE